MSPDIKKNRPTTEAGLAVEDRTPGVARAPDMEHEDMTVDEVQKSRISYLAP